MTGNTVTGAESLILSLEHAGAEVVFGLPGGAILPAYDPLMDAKKLRHILVRHEQGAGHAASGYAHATGKVGVAIATSGPGATNLITAIADAQMDSIPMVVITGQVGSSFIGTDAFQEADIVGMTMPVTKHNFLVSNADEIPMTIKKAFHIASTGRPGVVLVDITKDAQQAQTTFEWPEEVGLLGYRLPPRPHPKRLREAVELMLTARRPVFLLGGGVLRGRATKEVRELVDESAIPFVTTLMARGALPDSHPGHLGMPGMHGSVSAVSALQRADLIIAIGARFDDRVTGRLDSFAPGAKIIHADVDPAEISKNREADVPIVGEAAEVAVGMLKELRAALEEDDPRDYEAWWSVLENLRETYPLGWTQTADGYTAPQKVISRISAISGPDSIYASGVGQHQMWSAQFIDFENPYTWLNSGGLGTMGYSVPAAMGAKVGRPDMPVWAIDGDGCFQMTNQELATCVINEIPIKVAIINNSSLGMVRQWQNLFYNQRYSHTDLNTGHGTRRIPDFVKMADAYGCAGLRCERDEDIDDTIRAAMEINDRPVVIDFTVSADAMVWPMVPAGVSNDEIQIAKGMTPEWEREI
ncbi:acetolactate synthase large subunit [Helcobacillus massiliensis]|uniref:acetolactate synthase large subunit n=1 Tax=Helcobacillus massiliensis TaxID=521392 RepID=UPI0021A8EC48|nr:acetolactate synthase large subunit [Helcobacillus massiliensis]MCT1557326.1 acetolactate synthase large subunit [Helcobacillus massiliensis]MCT2036195.1 acetolactate synthase large subunit [Helcobacillus massiliensis]MCT2331611.1 acetolactate synthase large subunit [Helcobacillus massiliensis]